MDAETETEQIARGLKLRGGAEVALLNRLVERYQDRLVRYLVHLLGRREHVEDLVQETWLRVLERGRQYDGRLRFEPWLFAIARNLALDLLRKKPVLGLDASEGPASPHPSPFEATAKTEEAARLARSLAALEPLAREALLLRFRKRCPCWRSRASSRRRCPPCPRASIAAWRLCERSWRRE